MEPSPTERFEALLAGAAGVLPLDEAVLLVAAHDHPVDVAGALARLDELAAGCEPATIDGLRRHLFDELGFTGDAEDYHHPDNSFLDRVLERRRGLPILLSVLTAEVAARCGLCLAPVGMPGHFLVRECGSEDVFLDPFAGGVLLDRRGCRAIFDRLHPGTPFDEQFLDPVDSRAVLTRILTNLIRTFVQTRQVAALGWALHLRAVVVGGDAWLAAARARERVGEWELAAVAWERLAATGRTDAAAPAANRAVAARARAN